MKRERFSFLLFAAILVLALLTMAFCLHTPSTCTAKQAAPIRAEPSCTGAATGYLSQGESVPIVQAVGNWYLIKSDTHAGYVCAKVCEEAAR